MSPQRANLDHLAALWTRRRLAAAARRRRRRRRRQQGGAGVVAPPPPARLARLAEYDDFPPDDRAVGRDLDSVGQLSLFADEGRHEAGALLVGGPAVGVRPGPWVGHSVSQLSCYNLDLY